MKPATMPATMPEATLDRPRPTHVEASMTVTRRSDLRRIARGQLSRRNLRSRAWSGVLASLLFGVLLGPLVGTTAGCGGKDKKPTIPTAGAPGQGGMTDREPDGTGPAGSGGDNASGGGNSDVTGLDGGNGAPIVPPNLDPDPAQARTQVDGHLRAARAALAANPPDPEAALRETRLALSVDAANIDAAAMTAHALYHKRLYDTAEVMLDELYRRPLAKQNANVAYVYGLVYDKLGKSAEALLAFKNAVQLDPKHASASVNLGVYQLKNKQYSEAAATYERVQRGGRDTVEVWNGLGAAQRGKSGDYPAGAGERDQLIRQAETSFKRAAQIDRSYAPTVYNLGLLYLDADPFPGGLDTLQRLQQAKTYFDEYKNMPGADAQLYAERAKDVDKQIKREEKRRKKAAKPQN